MRRRATRRRTCKLRRGHNASSPSGQAPPASMSAVARDERQARPRMSCRRHGGGRAQRGAMTWRRVRLSSPACALAPSSPAQDMGTWVPDASGLATIAQLFSEYSVVGANQGQIYARLQQCSARPDFNNYLVHLLGQSTVRASAEAEPVALELRVCCNSHTAGQVAGDPPKRRPAAQEQPAQLLGQADARRAALRQGERAAKALVSWPQLLLSPRRRHVQACLLNCLALPERTLRITAGTAVRFASPVRVPALLEVRLTCGRRQQYCHRRLPQGLAGAVRRAAEHDGQPERGRIRWSAGCIVQGAMPDGCHAANHGSRLTDRDAQICEEDAGCLDHDIPGLPARPATLLVPRLLNFFARCVGNPSALPGSTHGVTHPAYVHSPHSQLQKRAVGWCAMTRVLRATYLGDPLIVCLPQHQPAGGLHALGPRS